MAFRRTALLAAALGAGPFATQAQPSALMHFDGLNDGRMLFHLFGPDRTDAAQTQRRPPSRSCSSPPPLWSV